MIIPRFFTRNALENRTPSYAVVQGADNALYPLSNAFTVGGQPAIPVTDANGIFAVDITVDTIADGWATFPWGIGISNIPIDVLIIGVSRHNPALSRFAEGRIKIEVGSTVLVDNNLQGIPSNKNIVFDLPSHTQGNTVTYRMTLSQLPADTPLIIPHLYIGSFHELKGVQYGHDPYEDKPHFDAVRFDNGSGFDKRKFVQYQTRLNFKYIPHNLEPVIDYLREDVFEQLKPFYYQFDRTQQTGLYLVKQKQGFASSPIVKAQYRDLTLQLEEWII